MSSPILQRDPEPLGNTLAVAIAALWGSCIALLAMIALFAVNFAIMAVPPDHYRAVITEAARTGAFGEIVHLPFAPDKDIYLHAGNDCLIVGALLIPRESHIKASVSPRIPQPGVSTAPGYPPDGHCQALAATMDALAAGQEPASFAAHYHRYIHGDVTVAALLLGFAPFALASVILLGACYAILAAIAVLAIAGLRSAAPDNRRRSAAFLTIAITLALLYGLPVFARSFSFGPTDVVILGFILLAMRRPLSAMSERHFTALAAAFGSVIAILEFMTGGVPLALATLIALLALDRHADWRPLIRRALIGATAFGFAVVGCFVYKQLAVWALWGENPFTEFMLALGNRADGAVAPVLPDTMRTALEAYHIDPSWIDMNAITRVLAAGAMLVYSSFLIAFGSHALGAIVVILPTLALLYFATRLPPAKSEIRALECLALAAAGAVPIVWYLVFPNHTILHSSFMVRPLALNVALCLVACPLFDAACRSITARTPFTAGFARR
jgi:hypothetical protein